MSAILAGFLTFVVIALLEDLVSERVGTAYLRLCPRLARRRLSGFRIPSERILLPSSFLIPIVAVPIRTNAMLLRESFFAGPRIGYPILGYGVVEALEGSEATLALRLSWSGALVSLAIGLVPMESGVRLGFVGILIASIVVQWIRFIGAITVLERRDR